LPLRKAFAFRLISPWFAAWFAVCQCLFVKWRSCFVFLGDRKPNHQTDCRSLRWAIQVSSSFFVAATFNSWVRAIYLSRIELTCFRLCPVIEAICISVQPS